MNMAIDDGCKLFVAGLPDSITEDVLRQLFEATGATIVEVSVPRDRATGRPRGFAFVTLATEEEAASARDTLDNSIQSGRSISVRPFQSAPPKRGELRERGPGDRPEWRDRAERPDRGGGTGGAGVGGGGGGMGGRGGDDRTLYLGNLPYDASVSDVETMLTDAGVGPIVRVTLPQDADGRPRGFGFVTLGSVEAAQAAVDALSAVEIGGRRVSASIARGRGERPARPPRTGAPPRADRPPGPEPRFDSGPRDRPPRMAGPPDAPPLGSIPDEGRRGDGRRRKEKKKKKSAGRGASGPERDEGRKERSRGGRRGRWGDEDDY